MKKILALFIFTLSVVVLLPSTIVSIFGGSDRGMEAREPQGKTTVTVLSGGEISERELEEYLFGVVAGEMPANFHIEALKAQAVAARTYIIHKSGHTDETHPDADVCTDSTHCKAYMTDEDIDEKFGAAWQEEHGGKVRRAISDTSGEIAVYAGEPIEAVFHSTGSGMTENSRDVWGGDLPYLTSVESPGDLLSPKYSTEITVSKEEFVQRVSEATGNTAEPFVGDAVLNDTGSVKTIDLGGNVLKGTQVRTIFALPSANFTLEDGGEFFLFKVKGTGHGVGMSQYGANYFADSGMDYVQILKTYYKGIEIVSIDDENN